MQISSASHSQRNTVKYFPDTIDMGLWKSLLYRGLDLEDEVAREPAYLAEARQAGADLVGELGTT